MIEKGFKILIQDIKHYGVLSNLSNQLTKNSKISKKLLSILKYITKLNKYELKYLYDLFEDKFKETLINRIPADFEDYPWRYEFEEDRFCMTWESIQNKTLCDLERSWLNYRYGDGRIICPECKNDKCGTVPTLKYYPYKNKYEHLNKNRFLETITVLDYIEYLRICKKCDFAWTDCETEDSQHEVIEEYEKMCLKRYEGQEY